MTLVLKCKKEVLHQYPLRSEELLFVYVYVFAFIYVYIFIFAFVSFILQICPYFR